MSIEEAKRRNSEVALVNEQARHRSVFGQIYGLAERLPWTSGLENLLEWTTWYTGNVLGITKTAYWKQVVRWLHDAQMDDKELEEKYRYILNRLRSEVETNESLHRYEKPKSRLASPREALRRAKYFSEDFLNKEYDTFMALASDRYLNGYYSQFTRLSGSGEWFVHGHSQRLANSLGIQYMQADNLAYCPAENILIANELKLGGRKNADQILKYAKFGLSLKRSGVLSEDERMLLLFIGETQMQSDWQREIENEIAFCNASPKTTGTHLLASEVIGFARNMEIKSTTWAEICAFNSDYAKDLCEEKQQVELKLLWGFNESIQGKAVMQ